MKITDLEKEAVEFLVQKIKKKWDDEFFYRDPMPNKKQRWLQRCSHHRPNVRDRLLRLNPEEGPEEGSVPRGWNPKQTARLRYLLQGLMTANQFRKKWGHDPVIVIKYGRRGFVPVWHYLEGLRR